MEGLLKMIPATPIGRNTPQFFLNKTLTNKNVTTQTFNSQIIASESKHTICQQMFLSKFLKFC